MPQYWVVGAMFGGKHDQYAKFIRRGYWYCWDRSNKRIPPEVLKRFPQIKHGDRIALKRMLGQGSRQIEVRAIGIVTDVDATEWRIYVDWLLADLARKVPINGCAGSIHGPYEPEDSWVQGIFQI